MPTSTKVSVYNKQPNVHCWARPLKFMQMVRQGAIEKRNRTANARGPVTTVGLAAMRFAVFHNPVWPCLRVVAVQEVNFLFVQRGSIRWDWARKLSFARFPADLLFSSLLPSSDNERHLAELNCWGSRVLEDSGKNCYGVTGLNVPVLFLLFG